MKTVGYIAEYRGKLKEDFKDVVQARKYAFPLVKESSSECNIYKKANDGNLYLVGFVWKYSGGTLYSKWPSDECWVLNRDGTLKKRID